MKEKDLFCRLSRKTYSMNNIGEYAYIKYEFQSMNCENYQYQKNLNYYNTFRDIAYVKIS